jgi:predicted ester cyclase
MSLSCSPFTNRPWLRFRASLTEENDNFGRRGIGGDPIRAEGNFDVIDELVAPDFVDLSLLPGQEPDREGYKRSVAEMNAPFSDISITIDEQVAEGDKVTTWYTGIRTHDRGPSMGVAPPGKRHTFTDVVYHRIVGGKIVEERSWGDVLSIMKPALEQQMHERERVKQDIRRLVAARERGPRKLAQAAVLRPPDPVSGCRTHVSGRWPSFAGAKAYFNRLTSLGFSRNTPAYTQLLGFRILLAADGSKEVEFGM